MASRDNVAHNPNLYTILETPPPVIPLCQKQARTYAIRWSMLVVVPRMLAQSCRRRTSTPSSEKQCGGRSREGAPGRASRKNKSLETCELNASEEIAGPQPSRARGVCKGILSIDALPTLSLCRLRSVCDRITASQRSAALCHVWTAPGWQGFSSRLQAGRCSQLTG